MLQSALYPQALMLTPEAGKPQREMFMAMECGDLEFQQLLSRPERLSHTSIFGSNPKPGMFLFLVQTRKLSASHVVYQHMNDEPQPRGYCYSQMP